MVEQIRFGMEEERKVGEQPIRQLCNRRVGDTTSFKGLGRKGGGDSGEVGCWDVRGFIHGLAGRDADGKARSLDIES